MNGSRARREPGTPGGGRRWPGPGRLGTVGHHLRRPPGGRDVPLPRLSSPVAAELTEREREVVALVAFVGLGPSGDELVRRSVDPLTAKTRVSGGMVEPGARDRAQLVVPAYDSGFVRPGRPG